MTRAYYNEVEPYAAAWLRNLIAAGHIAPGDVDERDIRDVRPADIAGYSQCHFFAGIGVWSYALRLAGWPDDRPIWTGSCPCQPFSAAGTRAGFADERHLWPSWHWLITQRRPATILGEQVASGPADAWADLVQDDLEALGYAFGAQPIPAAGVGAPHIRDRLWWVAQSEHGGRATRRPDRPGTGPAMPPGEAGWMALSARFGLSAGARKPRLRDGEEQSAGPNRSGRMGDDDDDARLPAREREAVVGAGRREEGRTALQPSGPLGRVADDDDDQGRDRQPAPRLRSGAGSRSGEAAQGDADGASGHNTDGCGADGGRPGPLHGFWRDADWLLCRDGKWRPVEPQSFPLAHGAPARVGRLRAYGNAIVAPLAATFIAEVMSVLEAA